MTTRLRAARTAAAALALVGGSLAVGMGPASATTESCHPVSSGYKSWVSVQATHVPCSNAHNIAKSWSNSCGRSSSTVTPMHCTVHETIDGQAYAFACANTKASQSPSHYHVHCTHEHRVVTFTFYPHGF